MSNSISPSTGTRNVGFRLGYITDVEGNYDFFQSYVKQSNVLEYENEKLKLRDDNCYFVFGGDAVDKGPGDIRFCRDLVSLKKRHPTRVFLLVGNRDLNKLRFSAELSEEDMMRPIDDIPPPHWDPKAKSLRQHLEAVMEETNEKDINVVNTRAERLRYILQHTLGCPETFEFRRQELALLRKRDDISDDDCVQSFLNEVSHGSLREYLDLANVAVVVGNTLFCHGAVDCRTIRFVPQASSRFENPKQRPEPGKMCDTLDEWVESLNSYLVEGMKDYQCRPLWDANRQTRGGEALMALQNRPAMWGRSIISNCYGDGGCITTMSALEYQTALDRRQLEETSPLCFEGTCSDPRDQEVADWLLQNKIQRVVVGHKPTGDCPAVLSAAYTGVEIVSADTSYSDSKTRDNRGCAVPVVELVGECPEDNHLELSGTLRDGKRHFSVFNRLCPEGIDSTTGDSLLGKQLEDGWWVKAKTSGREYQLCRGRGRVLEYKSVPCSDV